MPALRQIKRRHDAGTGRRSRPFILTEAQFMAFVGATLSDDDWNDDEDHADQDEGHCFDCGLPHWECDCAVGAECGRWRNGRLSDQCTKAGSEECDFECPYGR